MEKAGRLPGLFYSPMDARAWTNLSFVGFNGSNRSPNQAGSPVTWINVLPASLW